MIVERGALQLDVDYAKRKVRRLLGEEYGAFN